MVSIVQHDIVIILHFLSLKDKQAPRGDVAMILTPSRRGVILSRPTGLRHDACGAHSTPPRVPRNRFPVNAFP